MFKINASENKNEIMIFLEKEFVGFMNDNEMIVLDDISEDIRRDKEKPKSFVKSWIEKNKKGQ